MEQVKGSLADDPTDQNEGDAGKVQARKSNLLASTSCREVANRTLERARCLEEVRRDPLKTLEASCKASSTLSSQASWLTQLVLLNVETPWQGDKKDDGYRDKAVTTRCLRDAVL